jgi:hypothetical protein
VQNVGCCKIRQQNENVTRLFIDAGKGEGGGKPGISSFPFGFLENIGRGRKYHITTEFTII